MERPAQHDLGRLARYYEWCDAFRGRVIPAAAIAFTVRTASLRVPPFPSMSPPLTALDLAPLLEMLKHDSLIHRCARREGGSSVQQTVHVLGCCAGCGGGEGGVPGSRCLCRTELASGHDDLAV